MDSGLIKKTGIYFNSYTMQNSSIADYYIQCINVDDSGVVWLGTESNGVIRLDETLFTGCDKIFFCLN